MEKKAENLACLEMGTKFQREVPLFLEVPEFPYKLI